MPELTLGGGAVPCAFKRMKVADTWAVEAEAHRQIARIRVKYADLMKLKGDAYLLHADYGPYRAEESNCTNFYPYIVGAWAGDGNPPTVEHMVDSDAEELEACLAEIRRLNPRLTHLPKPPEESDPTPAA